MKKNLLLLLLFILAQVFSFTYANEPDSAYVFAYATDKNGNHNGLHFAWSTDGENWQPIGPEYSYLRSDYGRWGAEKRMIDPILFKDQKGLWHCLWTLNEREELFAHAASEDLVKWKRQSYPRMSTNGNCLSLEVGFDDQKGNYIIVWSDNKSDKKAHYRTTTSNFKEYTQAENITGASIITHRKQVHLSGSAYKGSIHKVSWKIVDGLIKAKEYADYKAKLYGETTKDDAIRFASLKEVDANISFALDKAKPISDLLVGVFFEDINYAADGGLYAELVQNRGFEYSQADGSRDRDWNHYKAWKLKGDKTTFTIDTVEPIHVNNKHYAKLEIASHGAALVNEGFDGIPVRSGDKYYFSLFSKMINSRGGKILIRLVDKEGNICGETSLRIASKNWRKQEVTITATRTVPDAVLEIHPQFTGTIGLDMISLFPHKTFKARRNGLRQDLAQVIADMNPRFVRFPGGCVAHGDGLGNLYRWENTIGRLEARKPQRNLWGYHQTAGLGYYEYFLFCEDIGAEPVPVVAAGVPCQNSGTGGGGQQGGIPMCEMGDYVQNVLDLVEWANGDVHTKWGKKRAEAGHPKPFNLKYIGVGNEDLITDVFEERFAMIYHAVKEKYPEITVIGTVGPFSEGTDYEEGWDVATKLGVPMVDEHYYQPPGWFIHNQDYYDRYDRNKSKVYLGEYAAHLPGRPNNMETALAEALYLTTCERNGDVVSMTSYAPLFAKEGHTQWNPDLIYFNNTEVKPTVGYQVQKLYGQHSGDSYIPCEVELSNQEEAVRKRIAISAVRDSKSGDIIIKMVNLLPVAVKPSLTLPEAPSNATILKYVLQGKPGDRKAKPVESSCTLNEMQKGELPAYSFVVYRIKHNHTGK